MNNMWSRHHTIAILMLMATMPALSWYLITQSAAFEAWFVALLFAFAIIMVIGNGTVGLWLGIFVDDRNVVSLSRLQMTLWTVLIITSMLVIAVANATVGERDPLDFHIPPSVWMLMGISTISFVGSPLALRSKAKKAPDMREMNREFTLLKKQGDNLGQLDHDGLLIRNTSPAAARFSDLITGDETGNAAHVDLAKLQLLFLTLIVLLAYAISIGKLIAHVVDDGGILAMPELDTNILSLIGISHAGYLTSKGVTQSKTDEN